jgi:hypothetical protein
LPFHGRCPRRLFIAILVSPRVWICRSGSTDSSIVDRITAGVDVTAHNTTHEAMSPPTADAQSLAVEKRFTAASAVDVVADNALQPLVYPTTSTGLVHSSDDRVI